MTAYESFDGESVRGNRGGLLGVLLLAVFLCAAFLLAVGAYGAFSADEDGRGELSGAVAVLRDFIEENEAVSVFLGFSELEGDESVAVGGDMSEEAARRAEILRRAEEYIKKKEGRR